MKKEYRIKSPDASIVRALSRQLKCHPATATVLANRGISGPEAASEFLSDNLKYLRSPLGVKDMTKAVRRIATALEKSESILIFGQSPKTKSYTPDHIPSCNSLIWRNAWRPFLVI